MTNTQKHPVDLSTELGDPSSREGLRALWHPADEIVEVVDLRGRPYWQESAATVAEASRAIETIDADEWLSWVAHLHGLDESREEANRGHL